MEVSGHCEALGQSYELGEAILARFCLPQGLGHVTELQQRFYTQLNLNAVSHRAVNM